MCACYVWDTCSVLLFVRNNLGRCNISGACASQETMTVADVTRGGSGSKKKKGRCRAQAGGVENPPGSRKQEVGGLKLK